MGATPRYGIRYAEPGDTASVTWTKSKQQAEDVEGRLAAVEDTDGGLVRRAGAQFTGAVSAPVFRFGTTGNEVALVQDSANPPVLSISNPGAALWATVKAGAFVVQSSRRYKERIRATRYGLADVLALPVVDFHYKAEHGDPNLPQTGFIAEDVDGLIPEAARRDAEGQPDSVDRSALVPILWRAVQELEARVRQLEARSDAT